MCAREALADVSMPRTRKEQKMSAAGTKERAPDYLQALAGAMRTEPDHLELSQLRCRLDCQPQA